MDKEQEHFLKYWFSGFMQGLEQVDENAQDVILSACGLACAQSYTIQAFQEAKEQSKNLGSFLEQLAQKFPEANYLLVNDEVVEVCYQECACDLVKNGWVESALLCKCSANNLEQNFARALGRPVQVKLRSSILGGAEKCLFEVDLL